LATAAGKLGRQIAQFSRACQRALVAHREGILEQQSLQARLGDTATELFVAACVYARLGGILAHKSSDAAERERLVQTVLYYIDLAHRRNAQRLTEIHSNDDARRNRTAKLWLNAAPQSW